MAYNSLTEYFTAIADAIREKTGESGKLIAEKFPNEILTIPQGANIELTYDNDFHITAAKLYGFTELPDIFKGNTYLQSVDLSETRLSGLIDYAFDGCSGLTTVVLPNTIKGLGARAFYNCAALSNINLVEGLEAIYSFCFFGCSSLTINEIPSTVRTVAASAFQNCTGITSLKIPAGCNIQGNYVFRGCSNLVNLELGGNILLTPTSAGAFFGCSALEKVWIRNTCSEIFAKTDKTGAWCQVGNTTMKIYCEASEAAENWQTYWNYIGVSGSATTIAETTYNVSTCPWAQA